MKKKLRSYKRHVTQTALKESEARYRLLIDNLPNVVFKGYKDWSIDIINDKIELLTGYSKEEFNSRKIKWSDIVVPDDLQNMEKVFVQALKTKKSYLREYRIKNKDGNILWIQEGSQIVFDKKGEIDYITGAFINISELKQAEERLARINDCFLSFGSDHQKNIQMLTALAGELLEGVCALYNRLDQGMLCSLGQWNAPPNFNPKDRPEGHICYDVIQQGGEHELLVRHLPETKYFQTDSNVQLYNLQTYWGRAVKCQGECIGSICVVFQKDFVPSEDDKKYLGIIAGALGVEEERQQAEEALRRSEEKYREELEKRVIERTAQLEAANQELEAFSYSVSHDLRAPLRGIDGFSRILIEDYSPQLGEEGRRVLEVIISETKKMGQLIDDLLSFSRLSRRDMKLVKIDMMEIFNEISGELLKVEKSRDIRINMSKLPVAYADRVMLRQAIINLLSNAVKFTRNNPQALIEVGGYATDTENIFYVRDNGVGFDMQYKDKLFGVFQRLHSPDEFEGTGVGLAIVQRIIHRHGGRVWAEGKVKEGAQAFFTLPMQRVNNEII